MAGSTASGGERLRALRREAGKTQLFVELEAELGSGYLQRVEAGKVLQPEKATLERILAALQVSYSERSAVLESFGYISDRPLPTPAELAWARSVSDEILQSIPLPAYLLDCAHHLLAWNQFIPPLFSMSPAELTALQSSDASLIEIWFTPHSPLHALVYDPDAFYLQVIHALEHEMHPFLHEQWCQDLLQHWLHKLSLFRTYWLDRERTLTSAAIRLLKPLALQHPQAGLLQFRLTTEYLTQDARFRIVYYLPANTKTERFLHSARQTNDP